MYNTQNERVDLTRGGGGVEYFHETTLWSQHPRSDDDDKSSQ